MEYQELGQTGVMVPIVGLGTWRYTGGSEPLRHGIELGTNLIDTAEMYRTEGVVGEAIAGIRDRVLVATKVLGSNLRYDEVLRAAERSLQLLAVDKIDLYQIHWPNPRVPIAETMRAMAKLVADGLVDYVGVSNFSVDEMQAAQSAAPQRTNSIQSDPLQPASSERRARHHTALSAQRHYGDCLFAAARRRPGQRPRRGDCVALWG